MRLLLLCLVFCWACASDEVKKRPVTPPKKPVSLDATMTQVADAIASKIPPDTSWMILVSVKGESGFEEAVTNALVGRLQASGGEKKSFMVTTPEIRKRILEEQAASSNDLYAEDTGAQIGSLIRADALLKSPLVKSASHLILSTQLIAMDSGAVVAACEQQIPIKLLPKKEKLDPKNLYSSYRSGNHALRNFPSPPNTAGLKVKLDRTQVYEGQSYNIECSTRIPGYLYIFDLQTDGTLSVLFPNCLPLEELNGGFLDNRLTPDKPFTTKGRFELTTSIAGMETILAIITEKKLDPSKWKKVYTKELGADYPQYHTYTFGRNGTIRDSLDQLKKQLKEDAGKWCSDLKEFSIVK